MARCFALFQWRKRIAEKRGEFLPAVDDIQTMILDQDEAQIFPAPLDKLLFKNDVQRVGKIQFRSVLLDARTLLAFENEFDIGRRHEGKTFGVVLSEPALRLSEKAFQVLFLKKNQDNLKRDQHYDHHNDMAYLKAIPRQFRFDGVRHFQVFPLHNGVYGVRLLSDSMLASTFFTASSTVMLPFIAR